ncbi:asparaginase [Mycena sanguinolenta]|nr:asparaginase [Mycena sanguinolenta]
MASKIYVVVHGGAGVHSKTSEAEVKQVLRLACIQTLASTSAAPLESGSTFPSALDLVEHSIVSLEDASILNAGYGSNLTLSGTVECDAALMDSRAGDFGSVGAVSGIKNPVRLARLILEHARVPDPLGRIPPLTLVSHGAHAFAEQYMMGEDGRPLIVPPESLVTPRAKKTWEVWKTRLEAALSSTSEWSVGSGPLVPSAEDFMAPEEEAEGDEMDLHAMQDTVGAVAFVSSVPSSTNSTNHSIAAGVSSGGILLKHPGRVGEAAVYGAGCWAQAPVDDPRQKRKLGMACSVSGAGEYIVRANLARAIADALNDASACSSTAEEDEEDIDVHAVLQRVLAEEFWSMLILLLFVVNPNQCHTVPAHSPANPDPSAGVVLLTTEKEEGKIVARLWCAFTTPSMAIAYASSDNPLGKALILRRPKSVESRPNDRPRIFVTGIAL